MMLNIEALKLEDFDFDTDFNFGIKTKKNGTEHLTSGL